MLLFSPAFTPNWLFTGSVQTKATVFSPTCSSGKIRLKFWVARFQANCFWKGWCHSSKLHPQLHHEPDVTRRQTLILTTTTQCCFSVVVLQIKHRKEWGFFFLVREKNTLSLVCSWPSEGNTVISCSTLPCPTVALKASRFLKNLFASWSSRHHTITKYLVMEFHMDVFLDQLSLKCSALHLGNIISEHSCLQSRLS